MSNVCTVEDTLPPTRGDCGHHTALAKLYGISPKSTVCTVLVKMIRERTNEGETSLVRGSMCLKGSHALQVWISMIECVLNEKKKEKDKLCFWLSRRH